MDHTFLKRNLEECKTNPNNKDALSMLTSDVNNLIAEHDAYEKELKDLTKAALYAIDLLQGYHTGRYGEQGDFSPGPVEESIRELKGTLEIRDRCRWTCHECGREHESQEVKIDEDE